MKPVVDFERFKPDIRYAYDLKPVLRQPDELKDNFPAYFMYRDAYLTGEDWEKIKEAGLRYDYTITPPAVIGDEYIKTYGHYHPKAGKLSFPEVYQVIEGKALFIIQKRSNEDDQIEDVVAVEVEEGEIIIVPPEYGHVMVNRTDRRLVTSNWVCRNFSSIYEPYTNLRGACYYLTRLGWVKNTNYAAVPELRFARPNQILDVSGDMYDLVNEIEVLEFLADPDGYEDMFKKALKFD
ncbi:glucose-6-phosphate isomerase family protein [Geoglobus acetivorans]|uniref:glucose-6-phosphate isomerase n=1 Tax=Geoglobus acetivorans TaxID=565033 RepID=A0ABZ3H1Q2_GEOAI|nr:glucose-6-phosphate isomerase [Geoglobus acetivorans]